MLGGLTGNQAPDFLRALYKAWPHLNARVDIFDVHAYASTPLNSLRPVEGLPSHSQRPRCESKPIWVSEVAWSSCLQSGPVYPDRCRNNILARNEAGQRVYLTRMYKRLINNASALSCGGLPGTPGRIPA